MDTGGHPLGPAERRDGGTRALELRTLSEVGVPRWNEFVRSHPDGTVFHLAEWAAVIREAFGHTVHYLAIERQGQIEGVLPLGRVRSWIFGDSLVSTPFCVYGGPLARDARTCGDLIDAARELAERLGVDYLELRNRRRLVPDWPCREHYVTFRREIEADPERNLARVPRKQRAMVRKGIRAGLRGEVDRGVERLFAIYSESVRNLGTPVFSRRYFRILHQAFQDSTEILTVTHEGRGVASAMSFFFGSEVVPYYGGGTAAARDLAGSDFLYWEVLRRAGERGCRSFDFGRSKRDVGSYHFKRHWGFEPEPLFYECCPVRRQEIPEVNPLNPRLRRWIQLWKRLPLPLTRVVGPLLSRSLG